MKFFRTETWAYATLLIILFMIASLAVWHIIAYLERSLAYPEYRVIASLIWTLTIGFMLIAGAFGLWTIQFSAESEARKRIARFVTDMNYISDGILAVDRKGRITGSNAEASRFSDVPLGREQNLQGAFPTLSDQDIACLLRSDGPQEVERNVQAGNRRRTIRFRSLPSEDLSLVLLSDVTSIIAQQKRGRHAARLQLIGSLAQGVASDFNDLLCGISSYAALVSRLPSGSDEQKHAADAISASAQKGIALAKNLADLTASQTPGGQTDIPGDHLQATAETLQNILSPEWVIELDVDDRIKTVGVSGIQIEQSVMNLGLLAADARREPGILTIRASLPTPASIADVGADFAAAIILSTRTAENQETLGIDLRSADRVPGVIESVIQSTLTETGGRLDRLQAPDGSAVYRIALPHTYASAAALVTEQLPDELKAYVEGWNVLLGRSARAQDSIGKRLQELKIEVRRTHDVIQTLGLVDGTQRIDAMVLDQSILGRESRALLRAILKLRPSAGIVVLCDSLDAPPEELARDVVFESIAAPPDRIVASMIHARSLVAHRIVQSDGRVAG